MSKDNFVKTIVEGYHYSESGIVLGTAILDKHPLEKILVKIPLSTINRHGLITGATGTGKTKTLQYFAEQLSRNGTSVLMMDVKGDISGLAMPGNENQKIIDRHQLIGTAWNSEGFPVELLSISKEKGVNVRATISEFGPVLFSKILELNDNQSGVVSLIFKYCDNKQIPLLDVKDFRSVIMHLTGEGKSEIKEYGTISSSSSGVILRKLIELEEQGADTFFGEPSFDVEDLLQKDSRGFGFINILRLCDIQNKPKLFSSFMLCLLAEIYTKFPEQGDRAMPKLVIFIDEAHLIFNESSKALLENIETIIKLIRSKGVGIYFCTQSPDDIPESVLGQLGLKIQHALRAFTAKDRKAINLIAKNYPITDFYQIENLITELGIGEALITALNEKGSPTPIVHTLLCAPSSRMDVLNDQEQENLLKKSTIAQKYNTSIDRNSAYELLNKKIGSPEVSDEKPVESKNIPTKNEKSTFEKVLNSSLTKTIFREVTRGLLGVLIGSTKKRHSSNKNKLF